MDQREILDIEEKKRAQHPSRCQLGLSKDKAPDDCTHKGKQGESESPLVCFHEKTQKQL